MDADVVINETPLVGLNDCSICLQTIEDSLKCTTQCEHQFCKSCLDRWFNAHHLSCPMCRQDIRYITHQGETTRIVCLYKKRPVVQTGPPQPQRIILDRSTYIALLIWSVVSFPAFIMSTVSWIRCEQLL